MLQDPDNAEVNFNHLCSEGEMAKPEDQAQHIPGLDLAAIKGAAEKASLLLPAKSAPAISYVNIKQAPSEMFMDVVDCLHQAVGKQVPNKELHEEMLCKLVKTNAKDTCKRVILTLPLDPTPSLDQIT